jgi:hypothetical protein
MRIDPTITNIALAGLIPASIALFATKRKFARLWAVVLATLTILDLAANLTGFGALFWWSPIHWPSTIALGVDEIVENHGVIKTTAGYLLDLVLWSAAFALGITIWKSKRKARNKAMADVR